tara:strand:+ start:1083 stop:2150 length:1068 start_codon:yes stop_codon:yes gene_type:complete
MGIEFEITANFSTLGRKAELGRATIPLVQDGEYIIIPNTSFYVQAIFTITEPQYHLNEIAGILLDQTYEPYGSIPHKEADQKIISGSKQIMRFPSAPGTKLIPKSGKNDYRVRLAWANRAETVFFTIYSPIPLPDDSKPDTEGREEKPDTEGKDEEKFDGSQTALEKDPNYIWLLKKLVDPLNVMDAIRDKIITQVGSDRAEEIFGSSLYEAFTTAAEPVIEKVENYTATVKNGLETFGQAFIDFNLWPIRKAIVGLPLVFNGIKVGVETAEKELTDGYKAFTEKVEKEIKNAIGSETLELFNFIKNAFISGIRPYLPSILLYGGLAILGVVLVLSLPRLVGSLTRGVVSGLFKS